MPQKPQAPKPLTKEEQAQQIARFLTQKREQYFQLILGNAIRSTTFTKENTTFEMKSLAAASLEAADYAIEMLYPLPAEPKQEEAK